MIDLETIESRLKQRRKELSDLRGRHESLQKRMQQELAASQEAFVQATGAIIELEELKRLAGIKDGNITK